jgi:hypothetical protein
VLDTGRSLMRPYIEEVGHGWRRRGNASDSTLPCHLFVRFVVEYHWTEN